MHFRLLFVCVCFLVVLAIFIFSQGNIPNFHLIFNISVFHLILLLLFQLYINEKQTNKQKTKQRLMHSTSVVVVNQTLGRNKKWKWLNKVYKTVDDFYIHDSNMFFLYIQYCQNVSYSCTNKHTYLSSHSHKSCITHTQLHGRSKVYVGLSDFL